MKKFAAVAADIPIISIGNITTGGTGKTPFTMLVCRRLLALRRKPAVLTRGYAAASGADADEVLEYRAELPTVPVIVGPDRAHSAALAAHKFECDCAVLDDGFQHRKLARRLDIVLIDATDPWGGGLLLPAGNLREPLDSLRRAHLFIATRCNQVGPEALAEIRGELTRHGCGQPLLRATVEPCSITLENGSTIQINELAFRAVLPVCGIGNPTSFVTLLSGLTGKMLPPVIFRDHHRYSPADVRRIQHAALVAGADLVLTTRKDWVKLAPLWRQSNAGASAAALARLDMQILLDDPEQALEHRLRAALEVRQ